VLGLLSYVVGGYVVFVEAVELGGDFEADTVGRKPMNDIALPWWR
jgi:hypothetical protein